MLVLARGVMRVAKRRRLAVVAIERREGVECRVGDMSRKMAGQP